MRGLARRRGLEIVRSTGRPGDDARTSTAPLELFSSAEYDVVPKGRFDIVKRDFYSPIPALDLLPTDIFERRSGLGGVELDTSKAMALVESELAEPIAEFGFPARGPLPPGEFFLENGNYEAVDAELLYAMVRRVKPRRIIELGSGYTSLLIGAACRRNAGEGATAEHLAYDPHPRPAIVGDGPPGPTKLVPQSASDVPVETFAELEAGDILFVDTTHTVKLGSDVNFVVLDVLPVLKPGVIVHFHDIFLPLEYPREWFERMGYYWSEQYLLQAFLAFNTAYEVLLPASALADELPDRLAAAVPSFAPGRRPGALWLQRR